MRRQIVVTGIGFVTRQGFTEQSVWETLCHDVQEVHYTDGNQIERPYNYSLQYRGINPCAHTGLNAGELAWKDASPREIRINRELWGVYSGTAFGGFTETQRIQCKAFLESGPIGISPALSIHSGFHLTGDIIAIQFGLTGPNTTFTTGRLASGMAFLQAFDDIRFGVVDGAVVVGTESIDPYLVHGHKLLGFADADQLSEGACSVVLESMSAGMTAKYDGKGIVRSVGCTGVPGKPGTYTRHLWSSLAGAIEQALEEAVATPSDIDAIVSTEGNSVIQRLSYRRAFKKIFGSTMPENRIIQPKRVLGDTIGANAIFGVGVGLLCLKNQSIPSGLEVLETPVRNVLVVADDPAGSAWATVLSHIS